MDKEKRKRYETYRKRKKTRRKRKIFRWAILFFIVVVFLLILRVVLAKQKVEEGASVVNLEDLSGSSTEERAELALGATADHEEIVEGYQKELQKFMRTVDETEVGKEAYEKSDLVMTIPKGQYVETYGVEDGYIKIRYQEKVGYVFQDQLKDIEDPNLFKVVRGLLIVNKKYTLPENYSPGLSTEAQIAFEQMREDAARGGLTIAAKSDFQDYTYQAEFLRSQEGMAMGNEAQWEEGWTEENNWSEAQQEEPEPEEPGIDQILPGQSEHQTGLAFDIWDGENDIGDAENYDQTFLSGWLKENAYKFGFILRYPQGKEEVTGYAYRPWHYRYVGEELAGKIYLSGLTLEEYFGIN